MLYSRQGIMVAWEDQEEKARDERGGTAAVTLANAAHCDVNLAAELSSTLAG